MSIFFISVVLGGLVLLAIFSMLSMARNQDEDLDRLEIELRREKELAFPGDHEEPFINVAVVSGFREVCAAKTNLLNR